jgi:hypothetical protein
MRIGHAMRILRIAANVVVVVSVGRAIAAQFGQWRNGDLVHSSYIQAKIVAVGADASD